MGKKNKKQNKNDNYWDEEYEKDQALVQEEVERKEANKEDEEEEEEEDIIIEEDEDSDTNSDDDDDINEQDNDEDDNSNTKSLPEGELSYTHGELDAAIVQIKYWILNQMRNDGELPSTKEGLSESISKFCVIPRKFPIEAVIAFLLENEVLTVVVDEKGNEQSKDIKFSEEWKKKCNSKKTKQYIKDQPPYFAHSFQQILEDVLEIESPPDSTQKVVELLASFTTLDQHIPPEEVIDELIERKIIIIEKRPIIAKGGKKSIEVEKIVYNEKKLEKVAKKGGMNVGLVLLVGLMILAGVLSKFL